MVKKNYAVGVDLGGTAIKIGIVSSDGKILKKASVDTLADKGPKIVISQIEKGINLVIKEIKNQIKGIGIGFPGVVNIEKGLAENPPNLPDWGRVPLVKIIEKKFGIKTVIENDAKSAAIGELIYGAGKNLDNFIMVTLGTGVGGGIIINRKIYRGEIGAAGEVGHTTINFNGKQCNCGSYGCLETYVGNNHLVERVSQELKFNKDSKIFDLLGNNMDLLTPKVIHDAYRAGDKFAEKVIIESGKYLGYGLASIVNTIDISKIIIGGGVAGFGRLLFETVEKTVKERALKSFETRIRVLPAKLKNEAGVKGASALVFYK